MFLVIDGWRLMMVGSWLWMVMLVLMVDNTPVYWQVPVGGCPRKNRSFVKQWNDLKNMCLKQLNDWNMSGTRSKTCNNKKSLDIGQNLLAETVEMVEVQGGPPSHNPTYNCLGAHLPLFTIQLMLGHVGWRHPHRYAFQPLIWPILGRT